MGWSLLVEHPGVLVGDEAAAGADVAGQRPRTRSRGPRRSGPGRGAPCGWDRPATGCRRTRRGRSRGRRPCAACSLKCSTVSTSPSASMPHSPASSASVARLLQPPALEHLLREVARVRPDVGVPLAVAVVEDQPAGDGPARLVALVHGLAHLHVRVRLVHEPPPGGVDVDGAGPLAGLVERRLAEAAGAAATAATRPRPSARSGRRAASRWRSPRRCRRGWTSTTCPRWAGRRRTAGASRGCGRSRRPRSARPAGPGSSTGAPSRTVRTPDHPAVLDDQVVERAPRSTPGCPRSTATASS